MNEQAKADGPQQPFILDRHDEEFPRLRELREEEMTQVAGGSEGCTPPTVRTWTATPDGDGGDVVPSESAAVFYGG